MHPLAGCARTTTYTLTFNDGVAGCSRCGAPGGAYACTFNEDLPDFTFTDTSIGTFVSLAAVLTADSPSDIILSINSGVQGEFVTTAGNGLCGTTLQQCSVVSMVPSVPQTGYVVGGQNQITLSATESLCFTSLVLTLTTATC